MKRRILPITLLVIGLVALGRFGMQFTRAQATISGSTSQITFNAASQTDPSISGDLVIFTDQRNGNDDIYFKNLVTDVETQVTSATNAQRLNDVEGDIIAFTDVDGASRRVMLYDVTTGVTIHAGTGTTDQNPRVDENLVVFERGPASTVSVWGYNRATNTEFPIADGPNLDLNPVVSGSRVLYESHVTGPSPGDILMFDTANSTTTVLEGTETDARRPDIDGNIVVWDFLSEALNTDIAIHDLSTGSTQVLTLPGNQRSPHISGRVVSFDDDSAGDPNIMLYHIPSGQLIPATNLSTAEFLQDISGNRIVYCSNQSGNLDIWMYEFTINPSAEIAPLSMQFGAVNVGSSVPQLVTFSNLDNRPVSVQAVLAAPGGGFSVSPTSPQTVPVGGSVDITVTFAPSAAGTVSNTLVLTSGAGEYQVPLAGQGVSVAVPPQQQIADILAFFDTAVQGGNLSGNGSGNSAAGRRNALRNMLEASGDLIQQNRYADACIQLQDALDRTDGSPRPPDFVSGTAAAELATRIRALRTALGCGA